jgi:hypothetical protein
MRKREPIFIRRGVKKAIRPFLHPRGLCPRGAKCSPALHLFLEMLPSESAPIPNGISQHNESLPVRIFRGRDFLGTVEKDLYISLEPEMLFVRLSTLQKSKYCLQLAENLTTVTTSPSKFFHNDGIHQHSSLVHYWNTLF